MYKLPSKYRIFGRKEAVRLKKVERTKPNNKPRPGLTPESRENQIIAAAMNLAEEQILNGTASSQVITHFLKAGSSAARLEKEKLEGELELLRAKVKTLESQAQSEELYRNAIKAFQRYSGNGGDDDDDQDVY